MADSTPDSFKNRRSAGLSVDWGLESKLLKGLYRGLHRGVLWGLLMGAVAQVLPNSNGVFRDTSTLRLRLIDVRNTFECALDCDVKRCWSSRVLSTGFVFQHARYDVGHFDGAIDPGMTCWARCDPA